VARPPADVDVASRLAVGPGVAPRPQLKGPPQRAFAVSRQSEAGVGSGQAHTIDGVIRFAVIGCGMACLVLSAGCGGADSSSKTSAPEAAAVDWATALASRDGAHVCSLMTPASVRSVERPLKRLPGLPFGPPIARKGFAGRPSRPCAKLMSHGLAPKLPAGQTTIHGSVAVVRMSPGLLHRVVLRSIDGRWLVDFDRSWGHPFGVD
jgi:hypothetical protein